MLAILLPIIYVSACILLFVKQRSLLYLPTAISDRGANSVALIQSEGETLRILTRKADSPDAVIIFGGNAEDISRYLDSFAEAVPKQNLFLVNYRGYSGSTGTPSEAGLFADAIAVYDYVHAQFPNVSVFGRSLGTGIAVYLASVRKVEKLVLITPYDSFENVAQHHFPIFPMSLLLKDKFDSASRVEKVTAKTLILIAEHDETIPRASTVALVQRFSHDQVDVKILPGTTHDSIKFDGEYERLIGQFLNTNPQ